MAVLSRDLFKVVESFKRAAPELHFTVNDVVISGANPSEYSPADPFPLWVIQVVIIVCFTQLLGLVLSKIRQPRVIAEIIGGIILGPTVMGRVPGFTNRIFPPQSIPLLTLSSTIGLVLFLFLIGLEVDVRVLRRNAKYSLTIATVGMIIPFALGVGLAVAIYHKFVDPAVSFGHFLLFIGVAIAITAFPVLCRILTDLNLLEDHVGLIVLSAGVGNDVVGWVLLALAVALTNASSALSALWILLAGVAFVLFMIYPGRWAFVRLARRTGSLENRSPSPFMMTVTLITILGSAFFTDAIGIHPIFGGFIAGLIVPHEGGFAIALVEKLEDLVCIVFLPLYFTLSGLRTDLGLLNHGTYWAYIVMICVVEFCGKFTGCALTAKLMGFSNREASAIGTLMTCKGLVELIVLNVGLQAGILDTKVFSMFVVHALVLTMATTPLTLWCYPPQHRTGRTPREATANMKIDSQDLPMEDEFKSKFSVVLNKIEHLPAIMTIMQLLQTTPKSPSVISSESFSTEKDLKSDHSRDITQQKDLPELSPTKPFAEITHLPVTINALRLMELTERTSTVMRSSGFDDIILGDPLVSIFSTFGSLLNIAISSTMSIAQQDSLATIVATHARDNDSQMVIIPWKATKSSDLPEELAHGPSTPSATTYNPFEGVFGKASGGERETSVVYENFVRNIFVESPADVALFVDRGAPASGNRHLFFPFFGGPDDRLALRFVVQLCANVNVTATIVRVTRSLTSPGANTEETIAGAEIAEEPKLGTIGFADTIYAPQNTQTRIASDTADDIMWLRYAKHTTVSRSQVSSQARSALCRIAFSEISSPLPLRSIIGLATKEASDAANASKSLLLVSGRGRRLAPESHRAELNGIIAEQSSVNANVAKTVGEVGAGFMAAATNASGILVLQAAGGSS
ncbi:Sodium/hydrogen exchanger family-domain-containing protein [Hysterangium stoloniferum]|nr:Sodium/hydrogen exchanger family-domain-containing protein [Hysterangium stoloniferum]